MLQIDKLMIEYIRWFISAVYRPKQAMFKIRHL